MGGKHGNNNPHIIFFLAVPYLQQLQLLGHAINLWSVTCFKTDTPYQHVRDFSHLMIGR